MSRYDEVVKLFEEMDKIALDSLKEFKAVSRREKFQLLEAVEKNVALFKETGQLIFNVNEVDVAVSKQTNEDITTRIRSSSLKENAPENHGRPIRSSPRPKRNALAEPSQMSNIQANASLNKNMLEHTNNALSNVTIKMERLTEEFTKNQVDLKVKQEMNEMPPPLRPPIKQTRKKKGARNTVNTKSTDLQALNIKVEQIDEENKKQIAEVKVSRKPPSVIRDSDVQIQCEPIHTISLVDSEEEVEKPKTKRKPRTKRIQNKDQSSNSDQDNENEASAPPTTRFTRTKTRNAAKNKEVESDAEAADKQKRLRSPSTEDDIQAKKTAKAYPKRSRTVKAANKQDEEINTSVYEDAMSNTENSKNDAGNVEETNFISKDDNKEIASVLNVNTMLKTAALNETITIKNPKGTVIMNETIVISKVPETKNYLKDIMTDDEDVVVSPPQEKTTKLKQVFSPYANSPVKQRVQAFEKLRAEANNDFQPRMTRTKTKAKAKEQEKNQENTNEAQSNAAKQGAIPKVKSSSTKKCSIPVLRTTPVSDNQKMAEKYREITSGKPKSAIKSSQAEFRERELKRKQKEAEASSKKEALMHALTEERRRKREERQIRAQQTRDALEKDKLKGLESAERVKQEKMKQMLAEKEEKQAKLKEEAARKRALALKKAAEEKQKEELKRIEQEKTKKLRDKDNVPPYLKYETPMLPTEDCYDSDDSNAGKTFSVPAWQKKELLIITLRCMYYLDEHKRHLFCNGPRTVNLKEIFPSIEPYKLKRTSSAVWNKSGMLRLASMAEEGEEGTAA